MLRQAKRSVGYAARSTLKQARERSVRKPPKNRQPSSRESQPTSANWPKNSSTESRNDAAYTGGGGPRPTARAGPPPPAPAARPGPAARAGAAPPLPGLA